LASFFFPAAGEKSQDPGYLAGLEMLGTLEKFVATRSSRRGRPFGPEKPPKSEALSNWTKLPHTGIFETNAFLDGLLLNTVWSSTNRCRSAPQVPQILTMGASFGRVFVKDIMAARQKYRLR
jgi:hypothetical protein